MEENGFRSIGATTYLCPTPTVMLGCAADDGWKRGEGKPNLVTVAWAGICCTKPPMISIALRPERFSYGLIQHSGEFTVNLIGETLLAAMDFCGVKSGRDLDKFVELGLHPAEIEPLLIAPALLEAPACLCCKVRQVLPLGTHDLFIAEIVQVHVNEKYFRADGSIDEQAMQLVAYVHGKYRALGNELGFFGYSVASEDALKRRATVARKQTSKAAERKGQRTKDDTRKEKPGMMGHREASVNPRKNTKRLTIKADRQSSDKAKTMPDVASNHGQTAEMKDKEASRALKPSTRKRAQGKAAKRG